MVQNGNGEQTNQLATGDRISGGAGTDTLSAKVIQASALNDPTSMAISPETVGVEKVAFTALTTTVSTIQKVAETAEINAQFMNGLTTISSVQSNASLLVTNVNTLKDDGVYAAKRNTEALTVRMDHSGNDAVIAESDMTVLLDNDYLLSGATTLSEALYWLLDEKAELAIMQGTTPAPVGRLANIDTNGLMFNIDGKAYTLQSEAARLAGTHAGFVAELNKQLALDIAAGKIPAGVTLALDTSRTDTTGLDNGDISNDIPAIVLSVTSGEIVPTGYAKPAGLTGKYDVYGIFDNVGDKNDLPITINVELEKVGRGSDGGDLTIGGMATDGKNEWDFSSSDTLEEGIEKFNITVSGDASQFSSLASLQSTNNTLQTVVVTSVTGSAADLIIGNHNTQGAITNALKDVRDFDSTAFANNVTLNAHVSDEAVAKYMDLKDTAAYAADNANFAYNFGAGADTLNLNISKANLAFVGTTTREDFQLAINTAAGDDKVTVQVGDGAGNATSTQTGTDPVVHEGSNWLINSFLNQDLKIDTGAGADTVKLQGAGVWNVKLGTEADTVYSDNSGKKAVWVFNTNDQGTAADAADAAAAVAAQATLAEKQAALAALKAATTPDPAAITAAEVEVTDAETALATAFDDLPRNINDLQSDNNDSHNLFKSTVQVSFKGFESGEIVIASTNYKSTDKDINQAIKTAINSDAELKKLLVAEDGPVNSLVVRSLIDGEMVALTDLFVTFAEATNLTTAEAAAVLAAHGSTNTAAAAVEKLNYDETGDDNSYQAQFATNHDTVEVLLGSNSAQTTANIIEPGTGDDVIVLSTGNIVEVEPAANDSSSDTVVYKGFGNGVDTIVNFTVAGDAPSVTGFKGFDVIDFSSYKVKSVVVDNVGTDGTFGTSAAGNQYIVLKESSSVFGAGSYVATVYTQAGPSTAPTTDTVVGVIGTLDFGDTPVFAEVNFII